MSFSPQFSDSFSHSEAPAVVVAPAASPSGVRRHFVEIDGLRREVRGYKEAEALLRRLKKEEKAQEEDRRKLKIHLKTVEKASVTGALYKQAVERVEVIEQRMDDRLVKMAELYEAIQKALDEQEEEEILLLL